MQLIQTRLYFFYVDSDGQVHHFLVISKIKIRSSKKCDLEDRDRDLEYQDHFTFSTQREVVVMMRRGG